MTVTTRESGWPSIPAFALRASARQANTPQGEGCRAEVAEQRRRTERRCQTIDALGYWVVRSSRTM